MSRAGFDLLFGVRLLAATILVGCSGGDDEGTPSDGGHDAATSADASIDRASDAPLDRADRSDQPSDAAKSDASRPDVKAPDVVAEVPELALCLRLMDPQNSNHVLQLSQAVGDQYLLLVKADCRVSEVRHPPGGVTEFGVWRDALYAYSADLWGCTARAPMGFALVSTELPSISPTDAAQLIELYLTAATQLLALTSREATVLRKDLQRLAGPVVTSESAGFTFSSCSDDAGAQSDAPAPVDAGAQSDAPALVDAGAAETSDTGFADREADPADADQGNEEGGD